MGGNSTILLRSFPKKGDGYANSVNTLLHSEFAKKWKNAPEREKLLSLLAELEQQINLIFTPEDENKQRILESINYCKSNGNNLLAFTSFIMLLQALKDDKIDVQDKRELLIGLIPYLSMSTRYSAREIYSRVFRAYEQDISDKICIFANNIVTGFKQANIGSEEWYLKAANYLGLNVIQHPDTNELLARQLNENRVLENYNLSNFVNFMLLESKEVFRNIKKRDFEVTLKSDAVCNKKALKSFAFCDLNEQEIYNLYKIDGMDNYGGIASICDDITDGIINQVDVINAENVDERELQEDTVYIQHVSNPELYAIYKKTKEAVEKYTISGPSDLTDMLRGKFFQSASDSIDDSETSDGATIRSEDEIPAIELASVLQSHMIKHVRLNEDFIKYKIIKSLAEKGMLVTRNLDLKSETNLKGQTEKFRFNNIDYNVVAAFMPDQGLIYFEHNGVFIEDEAILLGYLQSNIMDKQHYLVNGSVYVKLVSEYGQKEFKKFSDLNLEQQDKIVQELKNSNNEQYKNNIYYSLMVDRTINLDFRLSCMRALLNNKGNNFEQVTSYLKSTPEFFQDIEHGLKNDVDQSLHNTIKSIFFGSKSSNLYSIELLNNVFEQNCTNLQNIFDKYLPKFVKENPAVVYYLSDYANWRSIISPGDDTLNRDALEYMFLRNPAKCMDLLSYTTDVEVVLKNMINWLSDKDLEFVVEIMLIYPDFFDKLEQLCANKNNEIVAEFFKKLNSNDSDENLELISKILPHIYSPKHVNLAIFFNQVKSPIDFKVNFKVYDMAAYDYISEGRKKYINEYENHASKNIFLYDDVQVKNMHSRYKKDIKAKIVFALTLLALTASLVGATAAMVVFALPSAFLSFVIWLPIVTAIFIGIKVAFAGYGNYMVSRTIDLDKNKYSECINDFLHKEHDFRVDFENNIGVKMGNSIIELSKMSKLKIHDLLFAGVDFVANSRSTLDNKQFSRNLLNNSLYLTAELLNRDDKIDQSLYPKVFLTIIKLLKDNPVDDKALKIFRNKLNANQAALVMFEDMCKKQGLSIEISVNDNYKSDNRANNTTINLPDKKYTSFANQKELGGHDNKRTDVNIKDLSGTDFSNMKSEQLENYFKTLLDDHNIHLIKVDREVFKMLEDKGLAIRYTNEGFIARENSVFNTSKKKS